VCLFYSAAKASKKPADKTAEVPSSKDGKHHKAKPTSKKAQSKHICD